MNKSWKEKQTNENVLLSVVGKAKPCGYNYKTKEKLVRSYYEGRRTSKKCYRGKVKGRNAT